VSTVVPCPTCGRSVAWSEGSAWRPFCSERCKLIDLGAWASEQHAIPGSEAEAEEKPKTDEGESG